MQMVTILVRLRNMLVLQGPFLQLRLPRQLVQFSFFLPFLPPSLVVGATSPFQMLLLLVVYHKPNSVDNSVVGGRVQQACHLVLVTVLATVMA